jgi:hypothetical protein
MERTELFELVTEADVDEFCRLLRAGKELGPLSVRYTVAVTVARTATVRVPHDEDEEARSPLESRFHRLIGA